MNIADLYPVTLTLVLIGIVLGVGLLVLDNFAASTSLTDTAATSVNATRDAVADFNDWLPVIVIIVAAAVILTLVLRSFRT